MMDGISPDVEETESISSELEEAHEICTKNTEIFSKFLCEAQVRLEPKMEVSIQGVKGVKGVYSGAKINGKHSKCSIQQDHHTNNATMASVKENERKTARDRKKWMVSDYFLCRSSPTPQEVPGFASPERVMIDLSKTEDHFDEVGSGKLGSWASDDGAMMYGPFEIISEDNPNFFKGSYSLPSPDVGRGSVGAPDEEMGVDEDLSQTPECTNN
jgi:hypothetical protein